MPNLKKIKVYLFIYFVTTKGQIISKCLFGVLNFFQKTNENSSHTSKNKFIHLFFGIIHSLTICFPNMVLLYSGILSFRNYLTFKKQRREAENGENFTTTAAATNPGSAAGSNTKANEIGFTIVHCCSPSPYSEEIIEIILQRTKKYCLFSST